MRTILLFALVWLSTPVLAFSAQDAVAAYDEFRAPCRQAELHGEEISAEESQKYCVALNAIGEQLQANGWCWNAKEVEWNKCEE